MMQHEGKLGTHGLLFALREGVDDTVDGLHAGVRMQSRKRKVTCFGDSQCRADGLEVTHFADEDHVRVLAQRHLERLGETVRVAAHFALVDHATLVLVQKFNRVFDGQDMLVPFLVDLVDHGGKRRGLTGTGGTGDQDEAGGARRELGHDFGQAQFLEGLDLQRDDTEGEGDATTLQVGVRTETCEVRDTEREVAFLDLLEGLLLEFVHQAIRHAHSFVRLELVFANRSQFS